MRWVRERIWILAICLIAGFGVLGALGVFDRSPPPVEQASEFERPVYTGEWMVTGHEMAFDGEKGGTQIWVEYGFEPEDRSVWGAWIPIEDNGESWAQRMLQCYEDVRTGRDLPECAR